MNVDNSTVFLMTQLKASRSIPKRTLITHLKSTSGFSVTDAIQKVRSSPLALPDAHRPWSLILG